MTQPWRDALAAYLERAAQPREKFGHQPRLFALTEAIGAGMEYDRDVVYAAAYLHDLGVFVGHRPEDPEELSRWDHVVYTVAETPGILAACGFPVGLVPAVLECIEQHQPKDEPGSLEATILRDADILEQLGAVGILRTVAKVGRDTRFHTFTDAVRSLRRAYDGLPPMIRLESTHLLAAPRLEILGAWLVAVQAEAGRLLL
jgi:uncharacterized protein